MRTWLLFVCRHKAALKIARGEQSTLTPTPLERVAMALPEVRRGRGDRKRSGQAWHMLGALRCSRAGCAVFSRRRACPALLRRCARCGLRRGALHAAGPRRHVGPLRLVHAGAHTGARPARAQAAAAPPPSHRALVLLRLRSSPSRPTRTSRWTTRRSRRVSSLSVPARTRVRVRSLRPHPARTPPALRRSCRTSPRTLSRTSPRSRASW